MDPISVAAACVGLLSGLTSVSTKLRGFTQDTANANKEVLALQNELDSCQRALGLFYGSGDADRYPQAMKGDLEKIIRECSNVVSEIDRTLDRISLPTMGLARKLQWSMTTRDEVLRLLRSLEGHKSALSIAIALASLSMNRGIKSDTSSIRSKAARIPDIQEQLAAILEALHGPDDEKRELGITMQRFLQDAYAQSVTSDLTRRNTSRSYTSSTQGDSDAFLDQNASKENRGSSKDLDEAYFSGGTSTSSLMSLTRPFPENAKVSTFQPDATTLVPQRSRDFNPTKRKPLPPAARTESNFSEPDTLSATSSVQPLVQKKSWM